MDSSSKDTHTRPSSKLSLGSSPSVLSADEQLDGEGPLTPTDKIQDDEDDDMEDEEEDDDDLSALNSILQAGSPGSLSNEEVSDDDLHTEQDSASPLSSVPDDFPLSRSASPELPLLVAPSSPPSPPSPPPPPPPPQQQQEEEEEVLVEKKKAVTRKRRTKDSETPSPTTTKKPKGEGDQNKKRRASRSITHTIMTEPSSLRTRRRTSRQDEVKKEEAAAAQTAAHTATTATSTTVSASDKSSESHEILNPPPLPPLPPPSITQKDEPVKEDDEDMEEEDDDDEEEEDGSMEEDGKKVVFEAVTKLVPSLQENGECEDKVNNEAQDNEDHDYQQRHKEALDALTHIEVEFARLRDKMYEEKMSELNEEAIMIANGTHPELVTLMAEIEEKKGKRIHSAEAWRKHQHANFRQQFEGFEYQANIHFISQKNALRRNLLSSINGKRWNIEDERTKLNDPARADRVFPDGREMVAHKREQKEETGELQDIKEAVGFPMAPNPTGLSLQDVEQDLKILGIHR
ncbi:hypothetical protein INT47_005811 [Mucor saturninus]|uniref:Uncharacterized protein n=1 Tax=Mucor saturninus TaxID=64648 RepID=A0A8H7QZD6_9FUNG|nr:hypothetical protein INT47_005811 [Mucor saturninus]